MKESVWTNKEAGQLYGILHSWICSEEKDQSTGCLSLLAAVPGHFISEWVLWCWTHFIHEWCYGWSGNGMQEERRGTVMILFHGSNIEINRIDLSKCRPYKDFGRGFYQYILQIATESEGAFPHRWRKRSLYYANASGMPHSTGKASAVHRFSV